MRNNKHCGKRFQEVCIEFIESEIVRDEIRDERRSLETILEFATARYHVSSRQLRWWYNHYIEWGEYPCEEDKGRIRSHSFQPSWYCWGISWILHWRNRRRAYVYGMLIKSKIIVGVNWQNKSVPHQNPRKVLKFVIHSSVTRMSYYSRLNHQLWLLIPN